MLCHFSLLSFMWTSLWEVISSVTTCKSLQLAARYIKVICCSFYSMLQPVAVEQINILAQLPPTGPLGSAWSGMFQCDCFNHPSLICSCMWINTPTAVPFSFSPFCLLPLIISQRFILTQQNKAVIAASSCDGHLENSDGTSSVAMWVRQHRL